MRCFNEITILPSTHKHTDEKKRKEKRRRKGRGQGKSNVELKKAHGCPDFVLLLPKLWHTKRKIYICI